MTHEGLSFYQNMQCNDFIFFLATSAFFEGADSSLYYTYYNLIKRKKLHTGSGNHTYINKYCTLNCFVFN